jgi:tRNA (Thr-GGU) A37 N-methylase
MPELGIFAQRAKHRPNPIGITAVELIGIAGNVVKVKGLDAIDGTPVLDLKPYVPVFDRRDRAIIPEWMKRLMEGYF